MLSQLPVELRQSFPAILTKRSGISKCLLADFNALADNSVGPGPISNLIRERHTRRHAQMMNLFYHSLHTRSNMDLKQPKVGHLNYSLRKNIDRVSDFSKFDDMNGYAGFIPSGNVEIVYVFEIIISL